VNHGALAGGPHGLQLRRSGSDPTTIHSRAELEDDQWIVNGHKWFTSGAVVADVAIAMVVTDPDAAPRSAGPIAAHPVMDTAGSQPLLSHRKPATALAEEILAGDAAVVVHDFAVAGAGGVAHDGHGP
jgi:acyl-CoA dehydrogenase